MQENYFLLRGASSYSESSYCSPVEGVPANGRVLELDVLVFKVPSSLNYLKILLRGTIIIQQI